MLVRLMTAVMGRNVLSRTVPVPSRRQREHTEFLLVGCLDDGIDPRQGEPPTA